MNLFKTIKKLPTISPISILSSKDFYFCVTKTQDCLITGQNLAEKTTSNHINVKAMCNNKAVVQAVN